MLFSNRYYIQLAALNGTSDVLVHNQSNAVAVDFDWESKCVFWSDVTSRGSSLRKVCGWDKGENRSKGPSINDVHIGGEGVGRGPKAECEFRSVELSQMGEGFLNLTYFRTSFFEAP